MSSPQDDLLEDDLVSLCIGCAKHPELKALVESDLGKGVCGVCGNSEINVHNPERFMQIANLMKALIRFHFSEPAYNGHWGGTSISDILLTRENPIIWPSNCYDYSDTFIIRVEEEGGVYPDFDEGICLYAGHDDDGIRSVMFSIPETENSTLNAISMRLDRENFYLVEPAMEAFISGFQSDLEHTISKGEIWYRSRKGVKESAIKVDWNDGAIQLAEPFKGSEIGALPPPKANAGRLNRVGVSVIYLANDINTSVAEIRPHPGHLISVGGFCVSRNLRVAKFDLPIGQFSASDARLETFADIFHIDKLLGSPVIPEEHFRYAVTQLLGEVLIKKGFDAVSFRSSVGSGRNICAFNPDDFVFDPKFSLVKRVDELRYEFSDIADLEDFQQLLKTRTE